MPCLPGRRPPRRRQANFKVVLELREQGIGGENVQVKGGRALARAVAAAVVLRQKRGAAFQQTCGRKERCQEMVSGFMFPRFKVNASRSG